MDFKNWLFYEVAAPTKPSSSVKKRNKIKNPGTNTAKPIIEYQFKTKLGNDVKVQFEPNGDNSYNIVFYVNNTLDDNSSKTADADRDPEILSGVLYIIANKSEKLNAQQLSFSAYSGKNDTKFVKNLEIEPYKNIALKELEKFRQILVHFPVKMIPPSQSRIDLFQRLNKGMPQPLPNLDTHKAIQFIDEYISNIDNPTYSADGFLNNILYMADFEKFKINTDQLIYALRNLEMAQKSQQGGYSIVRNRRAAVYEKLLQRYFSNEWDIKKYHTSFTLNRKQNVNIL